MKLYGLIGYPLEHSFSKKYFLKKFEKEHIIDTDYQNFSIATIDEFIFLINVNRNLVGLNVTAPYKQQVIRFLSEIDEDAQQINAVNAIKITREDNFVSLKGYNTDVFGFLKSVESYDLSGVNSALILGTGGAAGAVSYALKKLGISCKFVSTSKSGTDIISYEQVNESVIESNKLIVNATPLGMYPKVDNKPNIPYESVSDSHIFYDLIYNPEMTQFLSEGRNKGAKTINGLKMLEFQAEKAWEIFNSRK